MTEAERFARLYRGYTARYGQYTLTGETEESGKRKGQARTLDKQVALADYAAHIHGDYGIGIIPLTEDDTVHFAAIDLDEYPGSGKFKLTRKDDETDEQLAERTAEEYRKWVDRIILHVKHMPLLATKSKSGGLHIWYFSDEGVPAAKIIAYLKEIAHAIGHGGCEVFPKQASRHATTDTGNWINLPFFGDTRPGLGAFETRIGYDVQEVNLIEFLSAAEQLAKGNTEKSLDALNDTLAATGAVTSEQWYDGPPCLQRLIIGDPKKVAKLRHAFEAKTDADFGSEEAKQRAKVWLEKQEEALQPQLAEGGRDTTFFNVSMYIARRDFSHFKGNPGDNLRRDIKDKLQAVHDEWKVRMSNPGLLGADIARLANQGAKDGWNYTCNQPPLKNHCDRRACVKRPFGIGSKDDDVTTVLDGFTKIDMTPPYFAFNVDGQRVAMDAGTLLNQFKFQVEVLNQSGVYWAMLPAAKFNEILSDSIKSASVVEGPTDTDDVTVVAQHLMNYLERNRIFRGSGQEAKFMVPGKALWSEDSTEAWFKIGLFHTYLLSKRSPMSIKELGFFLDKKLNVRSTKNGTSLSINGKIESVRPYIVSIPELKKVIENG